jgi:hypothetical protein
MASNVTLPASHTDNCLLFKLPPELRLNIYQYTHQIRLDNPGSSTDALNQSWKSSWESSPLVQLAATCRLIANEVRPIVHSLPASKRVAHVEISEKFHDEDATLARLHHLPCPLIDLRHIVVTCDSGDFGNPPASSDLDAMMTYNETLEGLGYIYYTALREFATDEALGQAVELKSF